MKINLLKRTTTYNCNLGQYTLIDLFRSENNFQVGYKNFGIVNNKNQNNIIIHRKNTQRLFSSARTQLIYNISNNELQIKSTPISRVYLVGLVFLYLYYVGGSQSSFLDVKIYLPILSIVIFLTGILSSAVYDDFNDFKKIIESTLASKKIPFKVKSNET